MIEVAGDLWDYHSKGAYIAITTNGVVRSDGACVMGRGVAQQAARRFGDLPFEIGAAIRESGNHVYLSKARRIYTYPVKHHWHEPADTELIVRSAHELVDHVGHGYDKVYLVRPGCGNGQLQWEYVKPLIDKILDDRFVVVERA